MALMYPGIWGVLQPVKPRTTAITSVLFPTLLRESLPLPIPTITADSTLRTSQYNFTFGDSITFGGITFTAETKLEVTIAYKTITFADSITFTGITFTEDTTLEVTIAYKTILVNDSIPIRKPAINPASSLVVTVNYVNSLMSDTLGYQKPVITSASTLV